MVAVSALCIVGNNTKARDLHMKYRRVSNLSRCHGEVGVDGYCRHNNIVGMKVRKDQNN